MTLSTGSKLSHYEISSQLGKGGMGEVYQAKDQKLGREVAIKVLPEEFAKDTDRVARFQREAKLLASLNHPNIAAIHGLEEADNIHFLVLELVEGQNLAERIQTGPMDVEEALRLGLQIAEALEAAHERGVIHRDLKPANIKVTPDNKVKVLDFGLAKAYAGEQDQVSLSNSPTLSDMATQQGLILGTAAYMSPEQARGKPVDKRTDVWAFGCVLYEMLTGQAAFQGEDVTEILAAVVKSSVNMDLLPANIHPRISEVLSRCLQKDQKKRYAGIGDVLYEIERVLADPVGVFAQPVTAVEPQTRSRSIIPWAVAILGIVIAVTAVWYLKPVPPGPVSSWYHEVPLDPGLTRSGETLTAISADGTRIVYVANGQLYLRELEDPKAIPIKGTDEDSTSPFFKPDGQWVGYYSFADSQWKKVEVTIGHPIPLCDAPDPNGASWGADGTILFAQRDGVIKRVSEIGGTAETVIEAKEGKGVYGPQILPGGEWVLFTITSSDAGQRNWDNAKIAVQSLKTDVRKVLIDGSDARYVPTTGHIVYAQGNDLYAVAFDIENMEVTGDRFHAVNAIMRATANVTAAAHYGFSDTGSLVYVLGDKGSVFAGLTAVWVDLKGNEEQLNLEPTFDLRLKISPDGNKVAFSEMAETSAISSIQIWDIDDGTSQIIVTDDSWNDSPVWTPDSQGIVFRSSRDNGEGIYLKAASGAGNDRFIGSMPKAVVRPFCMSEYYPDTIFVVSMYSGPSRIAILPMEGESDCVLLPMGSGIDPAISPDGKWLAYSAYDASGNRQVYVSPYPDVEEGGHRQISTNGGSQPLWSPVRQELYYRSGEGIIAVEYEKEPTFSKGSSETLFPDNYVLLGNNQWDIHPDGERFLMVRQKVSEDAGYTIRFVQNWFEKLNKRVPVE